jgi:hypothetical protein
LMMNNGAANSVAPSPRSWGGERVGVRGTPVECGSPLTPALSP